MNQGEQDFTEVRRRMRGLALTMRLVADVAAARCGCMSYGERGWLDVLALAEEEAQEAGKLYTEAGLLPLVGDEDEEPEGLLDHPFAAKADMRRAERSILPLWSCRRARAQEIIRSGERERLERALGVDPAFERRYEEWRASPNAEPGDEFRARLEREGEWEEVEERYYRVLHAAYERRREEHDRLAARVGCAMAEGWETAVHERAATMVATGLALDMARTAAPLAMRVRDTARRMREEAEKDRL
ncbi:MAG: hypothetical protein M3P49_01185 [Actinomycetota bacterium]|nr:hypothetical protein [Actinomycetota bacterium]